MKIGTRGSRLALAQAHEVRRRLCAAHGWAADEVEIVVIRTTGDAVLDRPLAEIGGKGLFTKEIEEALLDGRIDGAVHSMKDMPAVLPDGLTISTMLPREDVRDAFLSARAASLDDLPPGAKLGTSSVRRAAQALNRRPDLTIVPFRGNVQTRLKKLADGVADATFLACAGLNRLGLAGEITQQVPIEVMLPAVAQGAIGVEIRAGDDDIRDLLAPLNDPPTFTAVTAERGFMAELEGSCRTPLAAHAVIDGDALHLTCEALTLNGREKWRATRTGALAEAEALGRDAGREIARRAGDKLVR